MTLLGKIFTVMIFIMTVLFMGFAIAVYATHRNWKLEVDNAVATAEHPLGLRQKLKREEDRNRQLQVEIERLKDRLAFEQAARQTSLASLQTKLQTVTTQWRDREKAFTELQAANSVLTLAERTNAENLARLQKETDGLRSEIRVVQDDRDAQFYSVIKLTDALHQKTGVERILTERRDQLVGQLAGMKRVMDHFGISIDTPVSDRPVPVDGVVTAVGDKRLIEVSIGSDDGLRTGNVLEVYRNSSYLGRVVVRKTSPDRSVAEILVKYQKGQIKVKDRVATKLRS